MRIVNRAGTFLFKLLAAALMLSAATAAERSTQPNILFIAVDDLNHWVGHLARNPQTKTPNIDRLAARGVKFTRAYCAAPVCNPSRAALMSGLRPSTTGVYENNNDWRTVVPPERCMTTTFRNAGYWVGGAGKIYHGGFDRRSEWDDYMEGAGGDPKPAGDQSTGVGGIKFAPLTCRDDELVDHRIADWCIAQLRKQHAKPFFLACGFHKPHMPWNVPRKYFDMFPLASIQLPPHREDDLDDVPEAGKLMAKPAGDHALMLKSGRWKEAVQAYLATIAYLDMNVGRVLDALDKSPHRDNTIVCFWGDHGWHLGEKQHWRKFALWEEATRAPFIWVAPGVTKAGGVCERTVDFMSIYPTLCDLAGIPAQKHVEGQTIRQLLVNPRTAWETPALTTYRFKNHAVRSESWRLIRYADGSEELYDEAKDPFEWTNLAAAAEHTEVKNRLARFLPASNAEDIGNGRRQGRAARTTRQ